jgi:hypothetical protein
LAPPAQFCAVHASREMPLFQWVIGDVIHVGLRMSWNDGC